MLEKISTKIWNLVRKLYSIYQRKSYTPAYRIVEINLTDADEYIITVQLINKNSVFQVRPEEILADDHFVDLFSPRDIRALTYLGYLMLNNPKYKILAQRLSEHQDKMLFVLRKKGEKKIIVKTADEILKAKDILNNLKPDDLQAISYAVATENILGEKKAINALKEKNSLFERKIDSLTTH